MVLLEKDSLKVKFDISIICFSANHKDICAYNLGSIQYSKFWLILHQKWIHQAKFYQGLHKFWYNLYQHSLLGLTHGGTQESF